MRRIVEMFPWGREDFDNHRSGDPPVRPWHGMNPNRFSLSDHIGTNATLLAELMDFTFR